MSEEKLYAVKNARGLYLSMSADTLIRWRDGWREGKVAATTTTSQRIAHDLCTEHGGHVVTFVEEPEKVVLTKEQAEIVENARDDQYPATYISDHSHSDEERLIINAYVNGYTVAKEKKYLVYKALGGKQKNTQVAQAYRSSLLPDTIKWSITRRERLSTISNAGFTESEIEHYGLQDCEKEEVTDDAD